MGLEVGWVERSETHLPSAIKQMGFAALYLAGRTHPTAAFESVARPADGKTVCSEHHIFP
jgi:hypothetical protein